MNTHPLERSLGENIHIEYPSPSPAGQAVKRAGKRNQREYRESPVKEIHALLACWRITPHCRGRQPRLDRRFLAGAAAPSPCGHQRPKAAGRQRLGLLCTTRDQTTHPSRRPTHRALLRWPRCEPLSSSLQTSLPLAPTGRPLGGCGHSAMPDGRGGGIAAESYRQRTPQCAGEVNTRRLCRRQSPTYRHRLTRPRTLG